MASPYRSTHPFSTPFDKVVCRGEGVCCDAAAVQRQTSADLILALVSCNCDNRKSLRRFSTVKPSYFDGLIGLPSKWDPGDDHELYEAARCCRNRQYIRNGHGAKCSRIAAAKPQTAADS